MRNVNWTKADIIKLSIMLFMIVLVLLIPPQTGSAGNGVYKADSLNYYRINALNYIELQNIIIKDTIELK